MARDVNGSTDRIDYSNAGTLYNSALTISMWIWADTLSTTIGQYIFTTHTASNTSFGVIVFANPDGSSNPGCLRFVINGSSFLDRHSVAGVLTTGSWIHIAATHDGYVTAANCHLYINGVEPSYGTTSNGSSLTSDAGSTWSFGGRVFDDARNFDGRLAHVGVWNHVKGADELTALRKGYSPLYFRRGLLFAPDLTRLARDPITNQAGTLDGTTVVDGPPRIVLPRSPRIVKKVTAAPAAGHFGRLVNSPRLKSKVGGGLAL